MHDKLECGCKRNVQARIDMLVLVQATRARRSNNQKHVYIKLPEQWMEEQLRKDKQELKVLEQKKKSK